MAGKSPRRKGYGAERECVNICKAHGIEAKRTPTSKYPDLWINHRPVEIKRRKTGMKMFYDALDGPNGHDYVLFRADNRRWLKISYWGLDKP